MTRLLFAVAAVLCMAATPAAARHHHSKHHHHYRHHAVHHKHHHVRVSRHHHRRHRIHYDAVDSDTRIVSHPSGCPRRAFCGCGASVDVFGHSIRELWLARNWYRFPRSTPAPGMVAVRPHHVFVLRQHIKGSIWLVADYNSGGHSSRIHPRSVVGYTIVNPRRG